MKCKIRLTESQLHNIIRKNIKSVINEDVEHWKITFMQIRKLLGIQRLKVC